jgi:deazaflavin-dependent oxidoreductase (nitroreductase family)
MASQQRSDFGLKMMNRVHKAILKATGGRALSKPFGMPAVELRTIGSVSGQPRSTMLTSPVHDENRVVLVASKGGDDRNPQWYGNLTKNPDVELTFEGSTRKMRARTASAAEKEELWPQIVAAYKGYAGYQTKTQRNIPVVICEPRPA